MNADLFKPSLFINNLPEKFYRKLFTLFFITWFLYIAFQFIFLVNWKVFQFNWSQGNVPLGWEIVDFFTYFITRWIMYVFVVAVINFIVQKILKIFKKQVSFFWLINLSIYSILIGLLVKLILAIIIFYILPAISPVFSDNDNILSISFSVYDNSLYVVVTLLYLWGITTSKNKLAPN
jgi:hypothetical protein